MHHSRLSSIVIDCKTDDLENAARFWSQALGRPYRPDDDAKYMQIQTGDDEPIVLVQKVDHESRVHLDIESDDVEAEVKRLEALGAKRIAAIKTWVVMQAPTGQRFCVVRPQRHGKVGPHANQWR
ncbi:MAG TPA: VOC family protein [Rhodanobacteraceae bacterium]|nr:VOC family protein [Rhodanobacteraceae bacterium]